MRNQIFNAILRATAACKPLLMRLVPLSLLRRVKERMIASNLERMGGERSHTFLRASRPDGVNLFGFIRGEIGLGQSCRLVAAELEAARRPFTVYNHEQLSTMRNCDTTWDSKITNTAPYNINLVHINPYELAIAHMQTPAALWEGRYTIAFWLWELEEFPDDWCACFSLVDEIWTPAEFVSESIRKKTGLPVYTLPYALSAPTDNAFDRAWFRLPEDRFLFLAMYDCNSTMERKNPLGAVEAFKRAFPAGTPGVGLVLKVNNPEPKDLNILRETLRGYDGVYLLTDILSKVQVNSLISCVDTYVSLHRAEGFGLVPAEAMLLGTPVVATNWSANTEFMTKETSCLIDCRLVTIERECGPYPAGGRWADPDLDQAAAAMRRLFEDRPFREGIASAAREHIRETLGMERAAASINKRLEEIYEQFGT